MERELTPMQMYLQEKHGVGIEELLKGPLSMVAVALGVDKSTVSKWRKNLGLVPVAYCHKHHERFHDFCEASPI